MRERVRGSWVRIGGPQQQFEVPLGEGRPSCSVLLDRPVCLYLTWETGDSGVLTDPWLGTTGSGRYRSKAEYKQAAGTVGLKKGVGCSKVGAGLWRLKVNIPLTDEEDSLWWC